jgi:hypothetical protein
MSDADRYRKEQDLIFQEMEEMDRREKQAIAATEEARRSAETDECARFILRLCRSKVFQDLLMAVPVDKRLEMIGACWKAREENQLRSGTQI